jgi:hypothetical protein
MTPERFEALAQAYGGDVARWPGAEREAAAALMAAQPDLARTVLAPAGDLDAVLAAWAPLAVSHDLRERVIAAAPPVRKTRSLVAWLWGGAGLAGACAAGLVAGVALAGSLPVPADSADTVNAAMNDYDDLSGVDLPVEGA